MTNVPQSSMTLAQILDSNLIMMMSVQKRVMRNPGNLFIFFTSNFQGVKMQEPIDTLADALRSNDEGPPSILKQ